ncbi:MAG: TonB family protein [Parvibaculum sp.]|uniref:energy transducer TonB n=1 Tax=Parvibaculum sp. TaxID=2024848 RepID=UPI003C76AB07
MPGGDWRGPRSARRAAGLGGVLLLHAAFIWAFANGLTETPLEMVSSPVEVRIIAAPEAPRSVSPAPPPREIAPPPKPVPPVAQKPRAVARAPKKEAPRATITTVAPPAKAAAESAPSASMSAPEITPPQGDATRPNRRPPYPAMSRRLGEEGTVALLLHVTASGDVDEARIEKSSGYARLDKAVASEAMKSWRFTPAMKGGSPIAVWHRYLVTFRLDEE